MTGEDIWLNGVYLPNLLYRADGLYHPRSPRKLRLLACAYCRELWPLIKDIKEAIRVVELAERVADSTGSLDDLQQAAGALIDRLGGRSSAFSASSNIFEATGLACECGSACQGVLQIADPDPFDWRDVASMLESVEQAIWQSYSCFNERGELVIGGGTGEPGECVPHRELLHCVFGNPFRPLQVRSFAPHVVALACLLYEGDSTLYSILADALEELGESQAASHCRLPLHAQKGCHVIDWILNRS